MSVLLLPRGNGLNHSNPKLKPVGYLEVNPDHPGANGLVYVQMLRGRPERDLTGIQGNTPTEIGTMSWSADYVGQFASFSGAGGLNLNFAAEPWSFYSFNNNSLEMSCLVQGRATNTSNRSVMVGDWNTSASRNSMAVEFSGFTQTAGSLGVVFGPGSGYAVAKASTNNNQWYTVGGTCDGSTTRSFVDGVTGGTGTPQSPQSPSGTQFASIGQGGAWTGSRLNGGVSLFMFWNKRVPDDVMRDLTRDQSQLIRVVNPIPFFISAGGGAAELSGSLSVTGAITGQIDTQILLSGGFDTAANISGDLETSILLLGGVNGQATLSGDLLTSILLAGQAQGSATVTGDLSVGNTVELAGAINGSAIINGDLTTSITMAGGLTGSAIVTGDLSIGDEILLAGAMTGSVTVTAELFTEILLAGSLTGQASIIGDLTIPGAELQGGLIGSASITGDLTTSIELQGALSATGTITGLLVTTDMASVVGIITLSSQTSIITLH